MRRCRYCGGPGTTRPSWPIDLLKALASHVLKTSGDSVEKRIANDPDGFLARIPSYEGFWQYHIVPLSGRLLPKAETHIRPLLDRRLHNLADSSYSVFFHLAGWHECRERLVDIPTDDVHGISQQLFYLFSHAYSLIESMDYLAKAVNDVLRSRRPDDRAFPLPHMPTEPKWPPEKPDVELPLDVRRLLSRERGCECGLETYGDYYQFEKEVLGFRNFLVHGRPLFVHGDLVPKLETQACPLRREWADYARRYSKTGSYSHPELHSGLAAVGVMRIDSRVIDNCLEPLSELVDRITTGALAAASAVYRVSLNRLNEMEEDYLGRVRQPSA